MPTAASSRLRLLHRWAQWSRVEQSSPLVNQARVEQFSSLERHQYSLSASIFSSAEPVQLNEPSSIDDPDKSLPRCSRTRAGESRQCKLVSSHQERATETFEPSGVQRPSLLPPPLRPGLVSNCSLSRFPSSFLNLYVLEAKNSCLVTMFTPVEQ